VAREDVIAGMERDFLDYKELQTLITFVGDKPEPTVTMGYDTMISIQAPNCRQADDPALTDVWAKRSHRWRLIVRQATIAEAR
jgi:hypothetical protein